MKRLSARPPLPPTDAARLELEPRQAAEGHRRDLEADPEARPQRLTDPGGAGRVLQLDQDTDLVELPVPEHLDLELVDRGEASYDPLDRGREDVDAADNEHVVEPAEDAALQAPERPPARAAPRPQTHAVARAVSHDRRAHPPEIRQDQPALARRRRRHRESPARRARAHLRSPPRTR